MLPRGTIEGNQQTVTLVLSIGSGDTAKVIFEKEIPIPSNGAKRSTTSRIGRNRRGTLSITAGRRPAQCAGCDGRPNPADPAVKPTAATVSRSNEMNFLSQFAALPQIARA